MTTASVRKNVGSAFGWTFRDRKTGRIVIAQWPNTQLAVWLVVTVVRSVANPHGRWGTALSVVGTVALVVWGIDEVARGVNPWRRFLGAAVLATLATTAILSS